MIEFNPNQRKFPDMTESNDSSAITVMHKTNEMIQPIFTFRAIAYICVKLLYIRRAKNVIANSYTDFSKELTEFRVKKLCYPLVYSTVNNCTNIFVAISCVFSFKYGILLGAGLIVSKFVYHTIKDIREKQEIKFNKLTIEIYSIANQILFMYYVISKSTRVFSLLIIQRIPCFLFYGYKSFQESQRLSMEFFDNNPKMLDLPMHQAMRGCVEYVFKNNRYMFSQIEMLA